MSSEDNIPLILQVSVFILPMNIYVIGDWMGAGIQWMFIRYIYAMDKSGIIPIYRELGYVMAGVFPERSAYATVLWAIGGFFILTATLLIYYGTIGPDPLTLKKGAIINLFGAGFLFSSVVMQYGTFLKSMAGIAIPFGIPFIGFIAYWQYRVSCIIKKDFNSYEKENKAISKET